MALVEKLAKLPPNDESGYFEVAYLIAQFFELARGQITRAELEAYWNNRPDTSWDTSDGTDLDWLIGQYNAQGTAEAKAQWLNALDEVLILTEARMAGYETRAEIVAKIQNI